MIWILIITIFIISLSHCNLQSLWSVSSSMCSALCYVLFRRNFFPFFSPIQCFWPSCHNVVSELLKYHLFSSFFGLFLLIHLTFFLLPPGWSLKGSLFLEHKSRIFLLLSSLWSLDFSLLFVSTKEPLRPLWRVPSLSHTHSQMKCVMFKILSYLHFLSCFLLLDWLPCLFLLWWSV